MPVNDLDIDLDTSGVSADGLFKPDTSESDLPPMPPSMRMRVDERKGAKESGSSPAAESPEPPIAVNPLTGAIIHLDDIDSVIAGCDQAKRQLDDLRSHERLLRETAVKFTKGDAKTRRIQGHTLRAKVEIADISWDQSILREAWNSYPQFRDDYLKIGTVDVKLREYKKLAELATDDAAFQQFKGMLDTANRGPLGLPTVKIEE